MTDKPSYTNRLIHQKSPYLLQHAHNPVDWYPWGKEAFDAAVSHDRPIFLSIGYATCHWCHVMEKESFEDPQIAKMLNDTFINIKVDREELPEVDSVYMEFAQSMMSGAAGWPLNVVLTPTLKPFFAATYLPPISAHGLIGLNDLIARIREVWTQDERERIEEQADKVVEIFEQHVHSTGKDIPVKEMVEEAADILFKLADPIHGGIRGSPKFPIGYQANFMLRYMATFGDSRAVFLVDRTLDMMHRGGIYDHLGGGFSRYSVDEEWLVPHFEKMLYDNALLLSGYLEAWQATKKPLFSQVVHEVAHYVLRDMTHEKGGFFSAEDADTEGVEGKYYTWTEQEIDKVLGKKESLEFKQYFEITPKGNFEGRNILHTPKTINEFAESLGESSGVQIEKKLQLQKEKLLKAREKRPHPFKDDKILSSWNGLMIASLADAGAAFDREDYLEAAQDAAAFINANCWKGDELMRRWRDGEAMWKGGLDEYAFLAKGFLHLFDAGLGTYWLAQAISIAEILTQKFKSPQGAFFQTDGTDPNLIIRKCQFSDGAEPSGNAVHCENLLRLYQITGYDTYLEQARDIFRAVNEYLENYPPGYCYHVMNLNRYYDDRAPTFVVALDAARSLKVAIRTLIFENFVPHKVIIWKDPEDDLLPKLVPAVTPQKPLNSKTTLYICEKGVCKEPITDWDKMVSTIKSL